MFDDSGSCGWSEEKVLLLAVHGSWRAERQPPVPLNAPSTSVASALRLVLLDPQAALSNVTSSQLERLIILRSAIDAAIGRGVSANKMKAAAAAAPAVCALRSSASHWGRHEPRGPLRDA